MSVAGIHERKDVWNHTNTEHPGQDICKTVWSPTIHKQDRKITKLWGHNLQKMPEYILNNTCASHWPLMNRYSAYRNTLEYWYRECGEHEKHRCKVQTPTETSQRPGGCICRGITQAITNNMGKYTKKQMQTQTQTHTRTHTCTRNPWRYCGVNADAEMPWTLNNHYTESRISDEHFEGRMRHF